MKKDEIEHNLSDENDIVTEDAECLAEEIEKTSEKIDEEAELLKEENAKLKDDCLRAYAELENTKKRCAAEMEKTSKYAVSSFAKEILSVADNLHRALAAAEELPGSDCEQLKKGVELTESELAKVLAKFGVVKMEPMGKVFDPAFHRVVQEVEDKSKPAGTVVAKGKGSGFLREPAELQHFLDKIFNADLPIAISLKTRLGWSDENEFDLLADVYNHYPQMKSLTIHPRVRSDFYKGDVRENVFRQYFHCLKMPVGYNGDVITVGDIEKVRSQYAPLAHIMVGRALMADPALFRKAKGGAPATLEEIQTYYDALLESYCVAFGNVKNALMRMKEYWFFQHNLFEGAERAVKSIYKAKSMTDYQSAKQFIFENCELKQEASFGWKKDLS